ncbi:MAG: hypothetical protein HRU09_13450 [Oligoflexales bacterium]|nr:hypothetical protein [Oligoflexales bacterium]
MRRCFTKLVSTLAMHTTLMHPSMILGSEIDTGFLVRSSKLKLERSSNLLKHHREEHTKLTTSIENDIEYNLKKLESLENESSELNKKWRDDLAAFNQKVNEKQLVIDDLIQKRNQLLIKTIFSSADAEELRELNFSIENYRSGLAAMMQNNSHDTKAPATKVLISETYQASFDHLDHLKRNNQDEYRRLLKKQEESREPISVKGKETTANEEFAYEVLEDQFQERLDALFTQEETAQILKCLRDHLENNPRLSRFQIYYTGTYIISLTLRQGAVYY